MDLHQLKQVLGGDISGDTLSAPAPGHRAGDKSMAIIIAPDAPDGFVVHAHSSTHTDLQCKDYILEKLGRPPWKPNKKPEPETKAVPTARYVYKLADGTPYLRVTRMSDKRFLQAHWDGEGWNSGKPDGPKIPYRLPELLADTESPIFIVEGEKDADNLAAIGILATSSSEGAQKWTADVATWLAGRDVFILPDNDVPGRLHADAILRTLPDAKVILLPGLPPKGDATDWLEAGGTADALMSMAFASNAASEPPEPLESPLSPTPFKWVAPEDIPRRQWLYGRHLIRRYVSTTVAPGGLGKSSLVLAEAVAMSSGRPILGDSSSAQLRVWYWNGEDDQDENYRRIAAICAHHDIAAHDLADRLFIDTGREKDILLATDDAHGFRLNTNALQEIEAQLIANRIDVLIIDPFVASHNVGENDNMAINGVIRALARMAEHANCAIELVHHVRKPAGGNTAETDVNDARGASALIGGVRSARVLNVMSTEEAQEFGIERRFTYFRVDNGKSNLAPRSENAVWRHIASVDLQNGGELSSDFVGVVESFAPPTPVNAPPENWVAQVRTLVASGTYRVDHQSPDALLRHLAPLTGLSADDPADKKKLIKLIDGWRKSGILSVKTMQSPMMRKFKDFYVLGENNGDPETFE